jgi:sec-independent protein translocase protein TatB
MFDIGAGELLVIGTVALIAIGPKELPGVLRSVGQMVGRLKRMAGEFRQQFDDAMREADLHNVQKSVQDTVNTAQSATSFNPMDTIRNEVRSAVDEIKKGPGEEVVSFKGPPEPAGPPVVKLDPLPDVPPPIVAPAVAAPAPIAEVTAAPAAPAAPKGKAKARAKAGGDAA